MWPALAKNDFNQPILKIFIFSCLRICVQKGYKYLKNKIYILVNHIKQKKIQYEWFVSINVQFKIKINKVYAKCKKTIYPCYVGRGVNTDGSPTKRIY